MLHKIDPGDDTTIDDVEDALDDWEDEILSS